MKTLAVLQPSYLPWMGYFDQMARSDVFVFYDDVQYDKHGWRNRNRIKSVNGEPAWITVPVLHTGKNKQQIQHIEIMNEQPWARKQLGTIRQYYLKAPHFKRYFDELSELLNGPHTHLNNLNLQTTEWLCRQFKINPEIHRSSQLGIEGEQTERLVRLCQHFGVTHYLTGNAASDYLDVKAFENVGVQVVWQNYEHPTYPQMHGEFVGFLSALDLLMNVGPESEVYFRRTTEKPAPTPEMGI